MVKTVTIDYNGETIILFDGTVTNKCLIYENPDWKIKITLRDAISFQINIHTAMPPLLRVILTINAAV